MLNNFFRINLPYGIVKNDTDEWMAFNREYLPLGYNDTLHKGTIDSFDNLPIHTQYKRLTEKFLTDIAYGENGIQRNEDGNIYRVFLYNDKTNPVNHSTDKKELWDDYFKRLKKLSKLKIIEY